MKREVYTVFFDTGEWLWVKDADDETMYVGACVSFGSMWCGDKSASQYFLDFTKNWLVSFGSFENYYMNADKFDWATAHQQGLEVALRLKDELGDKADVRYVKPTEDPTYNREEGYEILSDGSILPIRRLWWTPV